MYFYYIRRLNFKVLLNVKSAFYTLENKVYCMMILLKFFSFSLTLIDSLDTLVVLGDLEEFEHAVKLVIGDVSFDNDVVISVFETNIRVLG